MPAKAPHFNPYHFSCRSASRHVSPLFYSLPHRCLLYYSLLHIPCLIVPLFPQSLPQSPPPPPLFFPPPQRPPPLNPPHPPPLPPTLFPQRQPPRALPLLLPLHLLHHHPRVQTHPQPLLPVPQRPLQNRQQPG